MYSNYCSGYKPFLGIPNINYVRNDINKRLDNFFTDNKKGRYGIIVMDFANESICKKIIDTNM
ncbi:1-phosphatidylinositol phosphodiesterase [Clostridium sp. DSM 8431]|uniref:hypothetical protein n=1 Tax=Clostridium sp. DSM 8431 TaxID=1761781 RepID=UPI0008E2F8A3|nr:hypothetical protein [Clostridium sp. DSM 8431]SFU89551.1 1-phosphatidylinositol phosphodiesterase [Clostridium sp. DSM 8431]